MVGQIERQGRVAGCLSHPATLYHQGLDPGTVAESAQDDRGNADTDV